MVHRANLIRRFVDLLTQSKQSAFGFLDPVRVLPPSTIDRVSALEICKESRKAALDEGYKLWSFQVSKKGTRCMMWNPKVDIVFIEHKTEGGFMRLLPRELSLQFKSESKEIQRLAIHTSVWDIELANDGRIEHSLLKFRALKELVVVLNEDAERKVLQSLKYSRRHSVFGGSWNIPTSVLAKLKSMKEKRNLVNWKIPNVRVVMGENDILNSEGVKLTLRCVPCVDLGVEAKQPLA